MSKLIDREISLERIRIVFAALAFVSVAATAVFTKQDKSILFLSASVRRCHSAKQEESHAERFLSCCHVSHTNQSNLIYEEHAH